MEGLSKSLANHGPVKVFAEDFFNCKDYDKKTNLDVTRIVGFKIFRKFRKALIVNDYLKTIKLELFFLITGKV